MTLKNIIFVILGFLACNTITGQSEELYKKDLDIVLNEKETDKNRLDASNRILGASLIVANEPTIAKLEECYLNKKLSDDLRINLFRLTQRGHEGEVKIKVLRAIKILDELDNGGEKLRSFLVGILGAVWNWTLFKEKEKIIKPVLLKLTKDKFRGVRVQVKSYLAGSMDKAYIDILWQEIDSESDDIKGEALNAMGTYVSNIGVVDPVGAIKIIDKIKKLAKRDDPILSEIILKAYSYDDEFVIPLVKKYFKNKKAKMSLRLKSTEILLEKINLGKVNKETLAEFIDEVFSDKKESPEIVKECLEFILKQANDGGMAEKEVVSILKSLDKLKNTENKENAELLSKVEASCNLNLQNLNKNK